jgi:hypothetical protein
VGHNPESLSFVRSSAIVCSDNSPSAHEPQRGQFSDDGSEITAGNKSWHVFKQNGLRLYVANNVARRRPHVPRVIFSGSTTRDAERLAGKASCNHVRNASVLPGCTGLNELTDIAEDGGDGQVSVSDSGGNDLLAVFVPFNIAAWLPTE